VGVGGQAERYLFDAIYMVPLQVGPLIWAGGGSSV
jgi:hypothetical protein